MQFADFKHQREINEILQRNHPLEQVLVKVHPHLVPLGKSDALTHPSTFARGPNGALVEIPFDPKPRSSMPAAGSTSLTKMDLATAHAAATGNSLVPTNQSNNGTTSGGFLNPFDVVSEANTEVSLAHPLNEDLDVFALVDERRMLERAGRRKGFQMKRLLYREIQSSQQRLNLCRNGMTDPFETRSSRTLQATSPALVASPVPVSRSDTSMMMGGTGGAAALVPVESGPGFQVPWKLIGTLGEVMDAESAVFAPEGPASAVPDVEEDLLPPSLGVKRKSFFFTEEDVDESHEDEQPATVQPKGPAKRGAGSRFVQNTDPNIEERSAARRQGGESRVARNNSRVILPPLQQQSSGGAPTLSHVDSLARVDSIHRQHSSSSTHYGRHHPSSRSPSQLHLQQGSPLSFTKESTTPNLLVANMSFGSVSQSHGQLSATQEEEMQRQREEFLKYPDVPASTVLARRDRRPLAPVAAGGGGGAQPLVASDSMRVDTRTGNGVSGTAPHNSRTAIVSNGMESMVSGGGGGPDASRQEPLPTGDRRRQNFQFNFRTADAFVERWHETLRRRKAEQQIKYTKKYKALDLHKELPFRASASAILHHVEHMIISEERASAWRDAHGAACARFTAMESYVRQHFHHPTALEMVQEARRIIVDDEHMPQRELFGSRILSLVPQQLFLLDDVTTVAVHVGAVFDVPKDEVVRLIRAAARTFIVDHCDALTATLA